MRGPCKEKGEPGPWGLRSAAQLALHCRARSSWLGGCAGSEARNRTEDVAGGVELEEGRGARSHQVSEGGCWPRDRDEGAVHIGVGGAGGPGLRRLSCGWCCPSRDNCSITFITTSWAGGGSQGSPCHPEEIPVPEPDTRPSPQL